MERFYGTRLNRYAVIPSPLQNIQIHMNVRVETPDGVETFMLVAPSKRAASAREFGCGFEDNPDLKWLVIHEYGHSFVNPMLEAPEIKAKIDRHAHLHGPIKDEQAMQGMSDWFGAVIEHVNRLGEIRILESVGDKEGAQNRRLDNVFARDFIYLPLLEDRVKEYETDRKSYPTFESFVPRLIDTFSDAPADAKP